MATVFICMAIISPSSTRGQPWNPISNKPLRFDAQASNIDRHIRTYLFTILGILRLQRYLTYTSSESESGLCECPPHPNSDLEPRRWGTSIRSYAPIHIGLERVVVMRTNTMLYLDVYKK